ncbi:EAL domain-containing protein [Thauera aminoaromatica]|uniref:GGDEF domain-containing response regulator n=1 Tax=Thauera aminoaromatica TaxID=164330 RepID=A0A5C7T2C8_THASP|nr:EAL domain-containing protein [Thauera aminoaromatica]TXH90073.1 MAG: GGDEF domain-containing response regulator [Thauera aminoaromatica]
MTDRVPMQADADILIVDDNPANVELLLALLEDAGYQRLEGITDPRRVAARVAEHAPDLILLDVRMPHLNGLELMERLSAGGAEAPAVIILTAQIDDATRYRALELGARDFLTKPFDQVEVLQRIRNVLHMQRLMKERAERAELLEALVAERTQELVARARHDPLTGLPNRLSLLDELGAWLAARRDAAVLFLSIEGMDEVSRLHGFGVADELARAAARRLRECVPEGFLAVWNSTQWVLLCDCAPARGATGALAERLLAGFRPPVEVEHMRLHLGLRIGIAAEADERSPEQLVRMAALALPAGEGQWQAYEAELETRMQRRNGIREALRGAVGRDEFSLVYQPKVELCSGDIVGVEALLRWDSSAYGRVSPAEFVPIAEASGEILAIGGWVVRAALATLRRWREARRVADVFGMAINVSTQQLMQPDFAERLVAEVEASGVPPAALELEVTESGLMQDMALAARHLDHLARAGFRIAIDDFGTGHSSLAYLKALPVSVLKIDRAFIRELHANPADQRLTGTVIDMARHFEFITVAEGVEQEAQLERLIDMGCDLVQGFMFAPPLKEDALFRLMKTGFAHMPVFGGAVA